MRILNHDFLTEDEARRALNKKSRVTLYRARKRGDLVAYRIGNQNYYKPADLEAYVERCRGGSDGSTRKAA